MKKLDEYDSLWQWTRDLSTYHFDDFAQDDPDRLFRVIKNFKPNWQHHLARIKDQSVRRTWHDITQTGGSYGHRVLAIDKRARDIAQGGGDIDKIALSNTIDDFSGMPELQAIIDSFNLDRTQAKCHVQLTGQMFTRHLDNPIYRMFAKRDPGEEGVANPDPNLEDYGYDTDDIVRVTVMLEDWKPGQFFIYGNTVYQQWRAGDCHFFDWKNVPHATANASEHTRITLQITGLRTEKTDPILDIRQFRNKEDIVYV